ncbi:hypothetical protein RCH18_000238 [Flavobacterium sp. PL11]|uniref:IPExxxVDY family protein n=1 Tax=Flavobacterium sp. PL11 TaxID=3071717 RepID=UPI002E0D0BAD|nr:hypothetical protein [Flavobacterium sp. PL11]
MAIHKLDLGDFDEIDYNLIAIHTSIEAYRLAYLINQRLVLNLILIDKEIEINLKEGKINFSSFFYDDEENNSSWLLFQNRYEIIHHQEITPENLFSNIIMDLTTRNFLVPELKKVDYFLKIENKSSPLKIAQTMQLLNTIPIVTTAYIVEINKMKFKNNLIF